MIDRFAYEDQPPDVRPLATVFAMMAGLVCAGARPSPARVEALDRLLDARNAAIRAHREQELTSK